MFDFDVGRISFELVDDRPQFENQIKCPNCRALTLDGVEFTETGQTKLTELYLKNLEGD